MTKLSTVRVLDSLNSTFLSLEVQKIIASIIHPTSSEVTVKFDDVAPQRDQNSCGLFAVAFATSFCNGNDPRKFIFDVPKMRSHLHQCLKNKKMTEFPVLKERSFMMGKLTSFRVNCICRMPLAADDIFESKDCSLCNETYHNSCVSLQGVNIRNIPGKQRWICPLCAEECRLAKNYIITHKNASSSTVEEN